jgi:hypothetical protein
MFGFVLHLLPIYRCFGLFSFRFFFESKFEETTKETNIQKYQREVKKEEIIAAAKNTIYRKLFRNVIGVTSETFLPESW